MGNTHLRLPTKKSLREYADENGHGSDNGAVVALLAEHRELLPTRRENELLHRILKPYELDEEDCGGETEIEDRFDPEDTVCEGCKWMNIKSDSDFPCSHCIHNLNHVEG